MSPVSPVFHTVESVRPPFSSFPFHGSIHCHGTMVPMCHIYGHGNGTMPKGHTMPCDYWNTKCSLLWTTFKWITRALDKNEYVALAAIYLSAAFEIVNVDRLIKRLVILGLPSDVIKLIEIWLVERYFYVSVNGSDSMVKVTWFGIVQGSILGPILYAIFISPLFDIENLTCFADDNFPLAWNKCKTELVKIMEIKLVR